MLEVSPIYHTDKANTPILIMHGQEDTRVDPSQSMELYRFIKVRKPDVPVRMVFYLEKDMEIVWQGAATIITYV